ncbi:MAG: hypothetical protein OXR67_01720 [Chloroflexota bacterium]|nr:hypothetical protein [Chloroflexota bacterium]
MTTWRDYARAEVTAPTGSRPAAMVKEAAARAALEDCLNGYCSNTRRNPDDPTPPEQETP